MDTQPSPPSITMHIITQKRIWEAKARWPRTATALDAWYRLAKAVNPRDYSTLKLTFPIVDKVGLYHVFDIGGNKIRLIALIDYRSQKLFIRCIMDHATYDIGDWKER